ncbi:hypothetical protein HM1_2171 [Heliomicrobium modesticaldum Ice1]|uniref:Uncharacterized protein n=1 Tax=Heliobacterium modesticaldum (strain ATCC 51547 / Ice1) TaxID=498761 RepID=B0TGW6_HELMI|nr:hypothetical protein HM1_2171 [Heliomicrobium modesticaldum Ice1]
MVSAVSFFRLSLFEGYCYGKRSVVDCTDLEHSNDDGF